MTLPANLDTAVLLDGPFRDRGGPLKGYWEAVESGVRRSVGGPGPVVAALVERITLDPAGMVNATLRVNVDSDLQGTTEYRVTPYLTGSDGQPLRVAFPAFTMVLYEGGGTYRFSDFWLAKTPPPPPPGGGSDRTVTELPDGSVVYAGGTFTEDAAGVITFG